MKALIILSTLLLSVSALALDCTTPGDALSSVEIVKQGTKAKITIYGLDDSETTYSATYGSQMVGTRDSSFEFGGAVTDALLLNIAANKKSAVMAAGGSVYFMTCK